MNLLEEVEDFEFLAMINPENMKDTKRKAEHSLLDNYFDDTERDNNNIKKHRRISNAEILK